MVLGSSLRSASLFFVHILAIADGALAAIFSCKRGMYYDRQVVVEKVPMIRCSFVALRRALM